MLPILRQVFYIKSHTKSLRKKHVFMKLTIHTSLLPNILYNLNHKYFEIDYI